MSALSPKNHPMSWIRVGDLEVTWTEAQRPLSEQKARAIASRFDPDIFGVVTVLPAVDGKYHVADGQTRVAAVRMLFGDDEAVPCVVVRGEGKRRAAQVFRDMNGDRTKPSAIEDFMVAATAGDPIAVAISNMLAGIGLRISNNRNKGSIRCAGALTSSYKRHGIAVMHDALLAIISIWGDDGDAFDAPIVLGFCQFTASYGKKIDKRRLSTVMAKRWTPARLIGQGKQAREIFGGRVGAAICSLIVETYNAGMNEKSRLEKVQVAA